MIYSELKIGKLQLTNKVQKMKTEIDFHHNSQYKETRIKQW